MKKALLASAAVVATLAAAPAFAQAVGSVGAAYNYSEIEAGGFEDEGDIWTVDGAVAFQAAPSWTVTLDGDVAYEDDATDDEFSLVGTAHLTYGLSDARVGGFVGAADVADETLWAVGVEGEKYLERVTLSGQVAYAQIDDVDADIWAARGEARYFVSDNFRIDGGLGLAKIDAAGADADAWTVGLGGEYQFAASPWSLTAAWDHAETDDLDASVDTFMVGVRYSFGGDLKARDRAGAGLGGIARLVGFSF